MNVPTEHLGAFHYEYEDGVAYEVRCADETALHWRCTAGDEKGREATESINRIRLRPRQHLLSWSEADGLTVAQVVDYEQARVDAVITLQDGQRIVLKGLITRIQP
jgi:phenolic acid decarboxylase